jgi:hypothetical protein
MFGDAFWARSVTRGAVADFACPTAMTALFLVEFMRQAFWAQPVLFADFTHADVVVLNFMAAMLAISNHRLPSNFCLVKSSLCSLTIRRAMASFAAFEQSREANPPQGITGSWVFLV